MSSLCRTASGLLRRIELVVLLLQLGSSLFDTALQMVVKDRCSKATEPGRSQEEDQQTCITDFYMTNNLIIQFTPIIPAMLLARLGDRGWRRAPVVLPLCGYVLSRFCLLLVLTSDLPLQLMFGGGVLYGVCGGFTAYWPGVMTLVSLSSTAADRSKVMMVVELLYGAAGVVGSLASGHLFQVYTPTLGNGTILIIVSLLLYVMALIHTLILLQVTHVSSREVEENRLSVSRPSTNTSAEDDAPAGRNKVNMALLFAAAVLYDFAVAGAVEILGSFVLKSPLSWDATQVGYGNAFGSGIFLTSFLGVIVFRRCCSDVSLILIGMVSFATGIYFMSFVTTTLTFYLARSLNLFALIPMTTIRSLLSQQVSASSWGTTLTALQLALKFAGLAYIPTFTKVYQATLDWFPGFVFTLSSIFTVLAMIPISIVGCRSPHRQQYERI
ncbi:solute carrier family 46 member 2 [Pholidichthys leucotaenia]